MLLLFDIDGTLLIKASDCAHRDALYAAMREVHGIADPAAAHVQPAGRTDGEIARAIALQSGVSAERIDQLAPAVSEVTCREYVARLPDDLSAHVAPGMPELLAELDRREGTRLALLTGNFEPVARLKLRRAGLGIWFEPGQGGFGTDHEDRAALPGIARRRAGVDGESWPRETARSSSATPPTTSRAPGPTACAAWPSRLGPSGRNRLGVGRRRRRRARAGEPARSRHSRVSGDRERLLQGIREGVPFGIAAALVGFSFGVLAQPVMGRPRRSRCPRSCSRGSAQFAAPGPCSRRVGTRWRRSWPACLLNARFLAMGIALAPSLRGGPLRRALEGQTVVDASWALANQGGGRFDRDLLIGATIAQYPGWVGGTILGALGGGLIGDPRLSGSTPCSRRSSSPCSGTTCATAARSPWPPRRPCSPWR